MAIIIGNSTNEALKGGIFADTIEGRGGNDTLIGKAGGDILRGGEGDDFLVTGVGGDTVDGGAGVDTVDYDDSTFRVIVNLATGIGDGGEAEGDTYIDVENIRGSNHDDILTGDALDNTIDGFKGEDAIFGGGGGDVLRGGGGGDSLAGGQGDDDLEGGLGADILDGGFGVDRASYFFSSAGVTIDLVTGTGSGGDAQGDTLEAIEELVGSRFADTLTGGGEVNFFIANDGDDILRGGGGDDALLGGVGADTIDGGGGGEDFADYVNSSAGVAVNLSTGLGSGGDAQGDTLTGIENLRGSSVADALTGNNLANFLRGGGGDDTLIGGGGDDALRGEAGDDIAKGGAGADFFGGDLGVDTIDYGASAAAVSVNLTTGLGSSGDAAGDSYLAVENAIGSAFADALTGDGAANAIKGLNGDDVLTGNDGNDLLEGGAGADQLDGGALGDTASYAGSQAAVTVKLFDGTALGGDAQGDTLNSIERLIGSNFADQLTGDGVANQLFGGNGADTLSGGGGEDFLVGGNGFDTLLGGDSSDAYRISANDAGTDTVSDLGGGADVIDFGEATPIASERIGDDLAITLDADTKVIIADQFIGASRIEFAIIGGQQVALDFGLT